MEIHQMRRLLVRHVIRLTRVVAFEYGEQLAQVGLGGQLLNQVCVDPYPVVLAGGCSPNKPG